MSVKSKAMSAKRSKPKFRVGQRVGTYDESMSQIKIVRFGEPRYIDEHGNYWEEDELRPLTSREIGPRRKP